jgi:hypothetical protein
LDVRRSRLLNEQHCLNSHFLRIRDLDALRIEEYFVCAFQMEVDANDGLLSTTIRWARRR